jgi:hypothetical protein
MKDLGREWKSSYVPLSAQLTAIKEGAPHPYNTSGQEHQSQGNFEAPVRFGCGADEADDDRGKQ